MSPQDFMYLAIGVAALVIAGAIGYTLAKTWPILDRAQHVSRDIEDTTHTALRGPVRGVLTFLSAITRGGDNSGQQKEKR